MNAICVFLHVCRHHGSEVVKVAFLNQRFKKMGCFLTVTKDGILQFWSETFSMMESFRVSGTLMGLVECLCYGTLSGLVLGTHCLSRQTLKSQGLGQDCDLATGGLTLVIC